jgi:hypothetical protein
LAVLAIHLIRAGDLRWRVLVRRAVLWGAGALLPAALLGLSMLISSNVSTVAIGQVLDFLRSYSGVPLEHRLANFRTVVLRMHLVLLVLTVCWLGARSAGRVQICRAIAVLAGLAAVCAGGTDSGHYLVFLYAALALAIGLPIKQDAQLIPFVRRPIVAVAVVAAAALVGWAVAFGPSLGSARRATQQAELSTLPWDRGVPDPRLAQACPAGSNVVVWGWASELYVNYRWNNAIPVLNVAMFTTGESNRRTGYEMVRDAILDKSTDCVVDAVGVPFFFFDPDSSLTKFYPDISSVLHEKYRPVGTVIDCEACTVYVRR